jgi:hypothetical protein
MNLSQSKFEAVGSVNPQAKPDCRQGIDALILLAGGLRPSPLVQSVGISVLDLPLRTDETVLGRWIKRLEKTLTDQPNEVQLTVVAYTSNSPQPSLPPPTPHIPALRFVCDQTGLRGPAGTARDLCAALPGDATVLLAEAARYVVSGLDELIQVHHTAGVDTTVARNPDGTPAGVYITQKRVLDLVPAEGFIDLKEQWLNQVVDSEKVVQVHTYGHEASVPLRTWEQYLQAVRRQREPEQGGNRPLRFSARFGQAPNDTSLVMPGSTIAPTATIIDSIIMPDSVVEDGAVVVRSFVGSGVTVHAGDTVVDATLSIVRGHHQHDRAAKRRARSRKNGKRP